jgi:hypothetical protein
MRKVSSGLSTTRWYIIIIIIIILLLLFESNNNNIISNYYTYLPCIQRLQKVKNAFTGEHYKRMK